MAERDWLAIASEYTEGEDSLRALAKKHAIPGARCATARGARPGRRFDRKRARQRETGFSAAIRPLRTKKRQTKTTRSGSSA